MIKMFPGLFCFTKSCLYSLCILNVLFPHLLILWGVLIAVEKENISVEGIYTHPLE